mgnify:CR=1
MNSFVVITQSPQIYTWDYDTLYRIRKGSSTLCYALFLHFLVVTAIVLKKFDFVCYRYSRRQLEEKYNVISTTIASIWRLHIILEIYIKGNNVFIE